MELVAVHRNSKCVNAQILPAGVGQAHVYLSRGNMPDVFLLGTLSPFVKLDVMKFAVSNYKMHLESIFVYAGREVLFAAVNLSAAFSLHVHAVYCAEASVLLTVWPLR